MVVYSLVAKIICARRNYVIALIGVGHGITAIDELAAPKSIGTKANAGGLLTPHLCVTQTSIQ